MVLASLSFAYSASNTDTLECQFRDNSCNSDEVAFFYANKNFNDSTNVLSSNVAITNDSNYNRPLCCKSPNGEINITYVSAGSTCPVGTDELMYFTSENNSRVRFMNITIKSAPVTLQTFNISHYTQKACVSKPLDFAFFKILVSEDNFARSGFTCMYKTNDLENSLVSACDATFNGANQYKYTVWARLWEDVSSLACNNDCTSKLDGRVYKDCAVYLSNCLGVPIDCDGAILGSWVKDTVYGGEVQCSAPWNKVRNNLFTDEPLSVTSNVKGCENIISKSYPVVYNGELINMRIYMCGD